MLLWLAGLAARAHAATLGAPPDQLLQLPVVRPVMDCAGLAAAEVSATVGAPTRIASAERVAADNLAAYCKVDVVIDDYAALELHLPSSTWTQRLLFTGGMATPTLPIVGQLAIATWRDLGNRGHEQLFAENYQNRINFAYRAMHLQVLAAKAIIRKYYGRPARFSYFDACSEPGREGMMEVERFPQDFAGVAAGCPPLDETVNHGVFWSWNVLTNTGPDGKPILTAEKLPILHAAVLAQCDAADGVRDGLIADPLTCHPDLSTVECKAGEDPATCLTAAQVRVAQELYLGAHDAQGGRLEPIGVLPGSELAWTQVIVFSDVNQATLKTELAIKYLHSDPPLPDSFHLGDLKFDHATFDTITKLHYLYDATDPDLTAFAKAGHKLLMWQGLADATVLPVYATLYYTALQRQMGAAAVDQFARLYLLPGVAHCGGGDGPAIHDLLIPLMRWVERGVAPEALLATRDAPTLAVAHAPAATLTRPIFPYPYTSQYTGSGRVSDAVNFVKGPPRPAPTAEWSNWFGATFYQAGALQWCTATRTHLQCRRSR